MSEPRYAGFWIRVAAALIDTVLLMFIITPVLLAIYGKDYYWSETEIYGFWDFIMNFIFPAIVSVIFWRYKSATPGKMILKIKIVDVETGQTPSLGKCIGRYLGYYVSIIPLCLGLIWVGIDKRKQGWHDKLAGTLVIKEE